VVATGGYSDRGGRAGEGAGIGVRDYARDYAAALSTIWRILVELVNWDFGSRVRSEGGGAGRSAREGRAPESCMREVGMSIAEKRMEMGVWVWAARKG
jgi:hypothetical protein